MKYLIFILLIFISIEAMASDSLAKAPSILYPRQYELWELNYSVGIGVTALPLAIVEDEVNQSPIIRLRGKVGLPIGFSIDLSFFSNYLSNYGELGIEKNIVNDKFSLSGGLSTAGWFGHLNMPAIQLKSRGMNLMPYLSVGYDFDDFQISSRFDTQYSIIWTDDYEEQYLGRRIYDDLGYGLQIAIEQALWGNNRTALGMKVNYAKFYYQSWIAYNTIDQYFFFPEMFFEFTF